MVSGRKMDLVGTLSGSKNKNYSGGKKKVDNPLCVVLWMLIVPSH